MRRTALLALPFVLAACDALPVTEPADRLEPAASVALDPTSEALRALLRDINQKLSAGSADYLAASVEWLSADGAGTMVYFSNVGNKRLGDDFVPGDPRRGGHTSITYRVDQAEGAIDGLTIAQTTAAIDRAMQSWDDLRCSTIPIEQLPPVPGVDLGVLEFLLGLGGLPFPAADITHAGWLPAAVLDENTIAATATFIWIDDAGDATDIDGNGRGDVAFREILYNDLFTWRIDGNVDVETVALHESGHGLSQNHFGKLFSTMHRGVEKFHFAPRAVMNAGYTGVQQRLTATDNAGHCSDWSQWPNN